MKGGERGRHTSRSEEGLNTRERKAKVECGR